MAAAGKPAEFAKRWIYAPFPEYPDGARRFHREGTVVVKFRIGDLGNPEELEVIKSSGFTVLDDAAVAAVRRWKARKEYAGTTDLVPVTFELRQR
jgi:protein TonB